MSQTPDPTAPGDGLPPVLRAVRVAQGEFPAALDQRVRDAVAAPPASRRPVAWMVAMVAVAAAILIVAGWWSTRGASQDRSPQPAAAVARPQIPAATQGWQLCEVAEFSQARAALLRDLTTLQSNVCREGQALGANTLTAISANEVRLAGPQGEIAVLLQGAAAQQAAAYCQQMRSYLAASLQNNTLRGEDTLLLAQLAKEGDAVGIEPLRQIAMQEGHPLMAYARGLLGSEARALAQSEHLCKVARTGSHAARVQALLALGGMTQPWARASLRAMLNAPQDELIGMVVEQVCRQPDPLAVPALLRVAAADGCPDETRALAAQTALAWVGAQPR